MQPNRILITFDLLLVASFALFATLSPRLTYWSECLLYRHVMSVYCDLELDRFDAAMVTVGFCFWLFLGYQCYRASGIVAELKKRRFVAAPKSIADVVGQTTFPIPLGIAWMSAAIMPLWLTPLVASFGKPAVLAGAVWWMVISLSTLCYVGALGVCDAERSGEEPGTMLLSAGYNLGGAPGVYFAHKLQPGSKALAEIVKTPPLAAVFFGAVVVITVLVKMT